MNIWALMIFFIAIIKGVVVIAKNGEIQESIEPIIFGSIMFFCAAAGSILVKFI